MARVELGRHKKVTVIADDPAYDVGSDEWNGDSHEQIGVIGFDEPSETLIIAGVLTSPTNTSSIIVAGAETGTADLLDTLTVTDFAKNDIVQLRATVGDDIDITTAGNIITINNPQLKRLSTTTNLVLRFDGTNWQELITEPSVLIDNVDTVVSYI